jgi:hypothetical protein
MAYRKIKPIIREVLLRHMDGLTVSDLIVQTGIDDRQLRRALVDMDDVYIDRWYTARHQRPAQAVYCIVKIPDDWPRPEKEPNEKRTYNSRFR